MTDYEIWNTAREEFLDDLSNADIFDSNERDKPKRDIFIKNSVRAVRLFSKKLLAAGITDDQLRVMKKPTPVQMGVAELSRSYGISESEALAMLKPRVLVPATSPPLPLQPSQQKAPSLLQERGLSMALSEVGYGRAEFLWPCTEPIKQKKLLMIVAALATVILRSKDKTFEALRSMTPFTRDEMLIYDELAWPDTLDFEITDRQIMEVLNKAGEPWHGWEIECMMWQLKQLFLKIDYVTKVLWMDKKWVPIEGWKMPACFLSMLHVSLKSSRLSNRINVNETRCFEHSYHLWLGGLGIAFLSNLVQGRFYIEDLASMKQITAPSAIIYQAIALFKGFAQYRSLKWFERLLSLKGNDWRSTQNHVRIIRRAFSDLAESHLISKWNTSGRGMKIVFSFTLSAPESSPL